MTMPEGLSVVVCVFNGADRVTRFLTPLRDALDDVEFSSELVVVDDASTDGSAELIAGKFGGGVRVVRHGVNRGPAAARNSGALSTRYPWLLFCDDDLEVSGTTLTALWNARKLDTCLVPEVRDPEGALQNAVTVAWRAGDLKFSSHDTPVSMVAFAMSACMFVSRPLLTRAGGFDERFHIYYEDADAGFALRAAGADIRMLPGVAVTHHEHGGTALEHTGRRLIQRRIYESRWLFNMAVLTRTQCAMVLILGLPRVLVEAARKNTADPVRGYLAALGRRRLMREPRADHDLRSRTQLR